MNDLYRYAWPFSLLSEAIAALGSQCHLVNSTIHIPAPPRWILDVSSEDHLNDWIEQVAEQLGLEANLAPIRYRDMGAWLANAGPAIIQLPQLAGEAPHFILLLRKGRRTVPVLDAQQTVHHLAVKAIQTALYQPLQAPIASELDSFLDEIGIDPTRRERTRTVLYADKLGWAPIGGCWTLRLTPGASFWKQLKFANVPRYFAASLILHLIMYLAVLLSFGLAGAGTFGGSSAAGHGIAWALVFLAILPPRLAEPWFGTLTSTALGGLLKQRLLYGALRLQPEEIRHQGIGQLLGRIHESDAIEELGLNNGFVVILAILELMMAFTLLAAGAGGFVHALSLVIWLGLIGVVAQRYFLHRRRWTDARREMTHDLVEGMVGYRTRLVQESPEHWHHDEDRALEGYTRLSRTADRWQMILTVFAAHGWMFVGLLGLVPALLSNTATPQQIAVGLGGVILAGATFNTRISVNLVPLIDAVIVWGQVAPLFHAAARTEAPGQMRPAFENGPDPVSAHALIDAHHLTFRYNMASHRVLQDCDLQIHQDDRLLLEGPSGGGKSTLASLLAGLRRPESGRLRLHGLDQESLGARRWRKNVVTAPQFQENHVLSETFAFNLLMGRRWPPRPDDLREAEVICREIGLADLIDRMPGGMFQWIGEMGWQLSHGERSRLYLARTLLQGAELIILDESFAALDPENMKRALQCALDRAGTLLVIAHP